MVGCVFPHRWGGSFIDSGEKIVCFLQCLSEVYTGGGSMCGHHAYTDTGPAADRHTMIGTVCEFENLIFILAQLFLI